MTGTLGTGVGVLNDIDSEVLMRKLVRITSDLNKLKHPLQSSLLVVGTNQWFLMDILTQWEGINEKDLQFITDALSIV